MLPVMAGNPPADSAQPSGMKGMIVTVVMNVAMEPRAPKIPAFLFQNPRKRSAAISHSSARSSQPSALSRKSTKVPCYFCAARMRATSPSGQTLPS